jgi:hypothetical protein
MKSLCKSLVALAAVALVSTSAAHAVTTYHISGSTAYRAAVVNALAHILTSPTAIYSGSSLPGANDSAWQGTFGGATIQVECHFNGSLTGIAGLTSPSANKYNFMVYSSAGTPAAVTAGGQANFYSPTGLLASASGGAATTGIATENVNTDMGFSDAFQATAALVGGAAPTINASALTDLGPIGILPFAFIKSAAQTTDGDFGAYGHLTDITSNNVQTLFSGTGAVSAQLLTGNTADAAAFVYAVGRDQDSGTRIAALAESGFGVGGFPTQYGVTTSGGPATATWNVPGTLTPDTTVLNLSTFSTPTFPTIGGGYVSGGQVAGALECQGWDNSSLPNANYGYGIGYIGFADADGALASGLSVTSGVAAGSSYTPSSATGNAVLETPAPGAHVFYDGPPTASVAAPAGTDSGVTIVKVNTNNFSGATVSGSTVSGLPYTTGISVGDTVKVNALTGSTAVIPSGATVATISSNSFTLSVPATTNGAANITTANPTTPKLFTLSGSTTGTHQLFVDTLPATYVRPSLLTFNGVSPSQANINNGKYQFWEYEHFFIAGASATPNSFESSLQTQLIGTDARVAGYLLTTMNNAAGTTSKASEGQPIHF